MTTLTDAMKALDERKTAVWGREAARELELDEAARLMVGLDLDVNEATAWARAAARSCLPHLASGDIDALSAIRGMWFDGLLTGLLLAEMRSREAGA